MIYVKKTKNNNWRLEDDQRIYGAHDTKHKAMRMREKVKRKTEPREYTKLRRAKALEELDKNRTWKSLYDVENRLGSYNDQR